MPPLSIGDHVVLQNQRGPKAKQWSLSGTVVEVEPYETYKVKMDGSGRVTRRRRHFIKKIVPFSSENTFSERVSDTTDKDDDVEHSDTNADKVPIRRSPRLGRGEGVQGSSN